MSFISHRIQWFQNIFLFQLFTKKNKMFLIDLAEMAKMQ